mmetsp:Transcript_75178/g.220389  ORF Transcript_75178/g.220389 Transcript_75178/m.220389 type:complete len:360 (-) Transcript_75178:186-1265(-)
MRARQTVMGKSASDHERAETDPFAAARQVALEACAPEAVEAGSVSASAYYQTWSGHEVEHLAAAHAALRRRHRSLIFLAGDSSLDNKAWFEDEAPALNGYESFLRPPVMKADLCYWLNSEAVQRGAADLACLNTAVEATTLADRGRHLLPADQFIHDHVTADDYLIVSVGGNDVALRPSACTILNMLLLVRLSSQRCLRWCGCSCLPCAGFCGGRVTRSGVAGCLRSLLGCAWPPGLAYFVDLFGNAVRDYVLRIIGSTRPRKVIVCCIYFLDENGTSWADAALSALDYQRNPARLQEAIRLIFRTATQRIRISGTQVVAFPLFEVLTGKDSTDYVSRVEPSPSGGKKMAEALMHVALG